MSSEWVEMRLGDFIELKRGYDLPKKNRAAGPVPLVSSAGVSDHHSEAKVQGPGVVTGRYGTIGEVFYVEEDFWPLNTTLYVRDFKGNDPRFTYYFLKTLNYLQYSDKAAVPGVNRNDLHQAEIFVPKSTEEQRWIASILSALDDKISLNHQINQTLEQMAQAIFKSWFVDFEPVKAKIAALEAGGSEEDALLAAMQAISGKSADELARLKTENPEQYAELRSTAELFPSAMQDSELGEIPEGWEITTVEHLIELVYGKSLKKQDRTDGPYPVYGSGGIAGYHNSALVSGPGIVVGRKGTVGSVYWESRDFYPIDTTYYVKTRNGCSLVFAYYMLQTLGLNDMNTDAAVPGLNRNNVYRLEIPNFPSVLIERFESTGGIFTQRIEALRKENESLAVLRDTLLPKLLSGELSVVQAEEQVVEVLEA